MLKEGENMVIVEFILTNIFVLGIVLVFNYFFYAIYKNYINPSSIFTTLWIFILVNLNFFVEIKDIPYIYLITVCFAFILPSIIYARLHDKIVINSEYLIKTNKNSQFIFKILIFTLFVRLLQLVYALYVINSLGGSISDLFNNAERLRFLYLARSSNVYQAILANILNYISELGVILGAIYSVSNKKYNITIGMLLLSLLYGVFTMSKLSFVIDVIFVFTVLALFNSGKNSKDKKKTKSKSIYFFMSILVTLLLIIVSNQRGYEKQVSGIEYIESVTVFKFVSYLIGPIIGFLEVLKMNIDHGLGIMTFTPFLRKILTYPSQVHVINIGFTNINVYTLIGSLYIDFGYLGSILAMFLFSMLINYLFYRLKKKPTLTVISIYCIVNTAIVLSFFDWIGRQTFFWLFPIFVYIVEKFLIEKNEKIVVLKTIQKMR